MSQTDAEVFGEFLAEGGTLKRVLLQTQFRPAQDRAVPSVGAELRAITVQPDHEGAAHRLDVPANQFAIPSATQQVFAMRAEQRGHRFGLVTAQGARFAIPAVHEVDRPPAVDYRDPTSVRM